MFGKYTALAGSKSYLKPPGFPPICLFMHRLVSFFLFLSLGFAALARGEESIEDLIQRDVVEVCEKLNKPLQSACGRPVFKERAVAGAQGEAALTEVVEARGRCDRERSDAPAEVVTANFLGTPMPVSVLSKKEAAQVFSYVTNQKSRYAIEASWAGAKVCNQRAELIAADILSDCKVRSAKIFVEPSRNWWLLGFAKDTLEVQTKDVKYVWPNHHVANIIYVESNGGAEPYVMDPLLFNKPVPLALWEKTIKKNDPSATSRITSSSTYRPSFANEDDPTQAPNAARALKDLDKARRDAKILEQHGY